MKDYSHLFGWIDMPREVEDSMNDLPFPVFSSVYGSIKGSGKGKKALLHKVAEKVAGKFPNRRQTIGCCVSQGAAYAVDIIKAVDIHIHKDFEKWVNETATEDIYWGSRNVIGKGRLGSGDGSFGVWAAKYVSQYGALPRGKYGDIDLRRYSGQRARTWGRAGYKLPQDFIEKAKQHPVITVSQVKTWEEVRDLIYNGYAVTIASSQGFSSQRDSEGFARPQGTWHHQMCAKKGTIIKGVHNKEIQDIRVGDKVYDNEGNPQTVSEIYQRPYNGEMVKLKISGRGELQLTPNHPVLVFRKTYQDIEEFHTVDIGLYANKEYKNSNMSSHFNVNKRVCKWVNAEDVQLDDFVFCPKINIENEIYPEWIKNDRCKNIPKKLKLDNKMSWFLGLYAADGGVSKGHRITITCNKKDIELIEQVKDFIKEELGLSPSVKNYKNAVRIICYSSIVANTFYEWFNTSKNKRIPRFVMSLCDAESFIKGFVDGDGSILNNGESYKITNCNKYMIEDLHTIMLNLGMSPYINKITYKDKKYGNGKWSDKYEISWAINPKRERNWWSENNYICNINSIDYTIVDETVYNLEVENTHTYIANGIVVHNCLIGMDDEYRRPGALCQNSWGAWNSGPTRHDQPIGSFWIDAEELENRILRSGDCWAFSGYEGFKPQEMNVRWW